MTVSGFDGRLECMNTRVMRNGMTGIDASMRECIRECLREGVLEET